MQMAEVEKVRGRIDMDLARQRISTIKTPILVTGRDEDHLQGIFRTSFELLEEAGKDAEWFSVDHDLHGYIYPVRRADGSYDLNDVQVAAIDRTIGYLDRHLKA